MGASWGVVVDPGVDDAVALAVLAGAGAVPDLVVAVPGNVDADRARRNAVGVVGMLGITTTVRTRSGPRPPTMPGRAVAHGDDGFGGLADRLPPATAAEPVRPGDWPSSVLALTPLTAVAAAITAGEAVERVVWMGGATGPGNVTATAEFNAWCDPAAVEVVLGSGLDVSVVPLDVTSRVVLTEADLGRMAAAGPVGSLLADAVRTRPRRVVHDAVAAVAWLRPEYLDWRRRGLRCLTDGDDRGGLVDGGPGVATVAVDVDATAAREAIVAAVSSCGRR